MKDLTEKRRIEKARTPIRRRMKKERTPPKAFRKGLLVYSVGTVAVEVSGDAIDGQSTVRCEETKREREWRGFWRWRCRCGCVLTRLKKEKTL